MSCSYNTVRAVWIPMEIRQQHVALKYDQIKYFDIVKHTEKEYRLKHDQF